jgi:hypothetical protein
MRKGVVCVAQTFGSKSGSLFVCHVCVVSSCAMYVLSPRVPCMCCQPVCSFTPLNLPLSRNMCCQSVCSFTSLNLTLSRSMCCHPVCSFKSLNLPLSRMFAAHPAPVDLSFSVCLSSPICPSQYVCPRLCA